MGDSHGRRLSSYEAQIKEKVRGIYMEWIVKGGAHISYHQQQINEVNDCDIAVLFTGGNDLVAMQPQLVSEKISALAKSLRRQG